MVSIFSGPSWNPSGRVCTLSYDVQQAILTVITLALLYYGGFNWPWPCTGYSSYETRRRRVYRCTERRESQKCLGTTRGIDIYQHFAMSYLLILLMIGLSSQPQPDLEILLILSGHTKNCG